MRDGDDVVKSSNAPIVSGNPESWFSSRDEFAVPGVCVGCPAACGGTRRVPMLSSADSCEHTEIGLVVTSSVVLEGEVVSRVSADRSKERGTGVITRFGGGVMAGIVETKLDRFTDGNMRTGTVRRAAAGSVAVGTEICWV